VKQRKRNVGVLCTGVDVSPFMMQSDIHNQKDYKHQAHVDAYPGDQGRIVLHSLAHKSQSLLNVGMSHHSIAWE
jgi:hypothetical protein